MFRYILLLVAAFCLVTNTLSAKLSKYSKYPYRFALLVTNPLSGASKMGAGAELRFGQNALVFTINNYTGVYGGSQYKIEYVKYIKTRYRDEFFYYFKGASGSAQYDAEKLPSLLASETSKLVVGPIDYNAAGGGFGRRWNLKHWAIVANVGLKYTMLPSDAGSDISQYFRLFYFTGPGAVTDLNFRIGYQF